MKKIYESVELELIFFSDEDVICTSGDSSDSSDSGDGPNEIEGDPIFGSKMFM